MFMVMTIKQKTVLALGLHNVRYSENSYNGSKKINNENKNIILNCGYGNGVSVLDAIYEFQKQLGKKIKVKVKDRRKGDMEEIIANNKKIKRF